MMPPRVLALWCQNPAGAITHMPLNSKHILFFLIFSIEINAVFNNKFHTVVRHFHPK